MNVLWLNAGLLLPLDKGGKLRTWHLMRHLAQRHDDHVSVFADPSTTRRTCDGMREVCRRARNRAAPRSRKGTWRFHADAARYIVDPVPYAIAKYRSAAYRRRLSSLLASTAVRR